MVYQYGVITSQLNLSKISAASTLIILILKVTYSVSRQSLDKEESKALSFPSPSLKFSGLS